jgi:hypothetical protein
MAVLYGFLTYTETSRAKHPALAAEADRLYAALTDEQKSFLHSTLPPLLYAVGVPMVSAETIPVIAYRWQCLSKIERNFDAVKYLTPFIGVTTNVFCEADRAFYARMARGHGADFNAKAWASAERKFCAAVAAFMEKPHGR